MTPWEPDVPSSHRMAGIAFGALVVGGLVLLYWALLYWALPVVLEMLG